MRTTTAVILMLALLLVTTAHALPLPAVSFTETTSPTPVAVPVSIGWKFNVVSPVLVGALGVFDSAQDGLVSSHQVGIWNNASNTLLALVTVPGGSAGQLINQFRYADITPVLLGIGTYTIGATWGTGPGSDDYLANAHNFQTIASISYLVSEYDQIPSTSQLNMPTTPAVFFSNGMFGPSFAVVPEPASITLSICGLSLLSYALWRRHRAVS